MNRIKTSLITCAGLSVLIAIIAAVTSGTVYAANPYDDGRSLGIRFYFFSGSSPWTSRPVTFSAIWNPLLMLELLDHGNSLRDRFSRFEQAR